ncbi:MAG TPA: hypothetical protein VK142_03240 [Bacillota bacterium]|nr:hypothetical protein [Bacillota bacterium]
MSIIRYYVSGHTAEGYQNRLKSNIEGVKKKIFLNHPSLTLKTRIFEYIIERYQSSFDLDVFCSSWSHHFMEGVVIRDLSIAIMDGTLDSGDFPGATYLDITEMDKGNRSGLENLNSVHVGLEELKGRAYKEFETALAIHDDLEAIYIREMDFQRADQLIEQFISNQVSHIPMKHTAPHQYHRMFGTNTVEGAVNIALELMDPIPKRYILKGRAGTGKSVFMKRVAKACEQRNLDLELYHCSFDPSSIDMVLVRNEFCILDGTSPHEINPERTSDDIIDLYEKTVTPGTDENYEEEIRTVTKRYKTHMKKGLHHLKDAGKVLFEKEAEFIRCITEETQQAIFANVSAHVD